MKVLMLGWEFPPHVSGGLGTACQGIAEGLARTGVRVTLVVPRDGPRAARRGLDVLGCDHLAAQSGEREPEGPPIDVVAIASELTPYASPATWAAEHESAGFSGGYGRSLGDEVARYARVVAAAARELDFDVIHAHDWMTWPAALLVRAQSGRPLVCHVHSTEIDRSGPTADSGIRTIEARALAAADRIVCVSHFTAAQLRRHYDVDTGRLRVVHNAVAQRLAVARARWRKTVDAPIVLFLGRVTSQKGPERFLEAAARVAGVVPDAKFVLAGDGDLLPAMVERAAELGLARRVHFTGFLSGTDVERMYALADVYVMPSVSEPFGIAPLEAMSLDVPVIVSKQSGVSEVLAHALKVDGWDTEELANKILAVLRRPALARALVRAGRAEVRRLRWEHRARSLLDVFAELAA